MKGSRALGRLAEVSASRGALLSTSAAARRKGIDAAAATASRSMYEAHKRDVMPPPGWDPTLVDRVVSTTAADVMRRPCVVKPKPDQMVHYVDDNATVRACAKILNEKRIGVLMVNSAIDGSVVGIISERDFVKALADGSTDQAIVADLMTPIAKMVTVSVTTSAGECMELMRAHGIRHLPVMASQAGEGKDAAVENLRSVAEKSAEAARKQFSAFEAKLRDAFGDADGQRTYDGLLADPDAFASDERPLLRRASTAAAKLKLAEERLGAVEGSTSALQASHPVGIISIRDLLLTMTANQVVPLLDWLNEERRTLIEERVGYSE